MSIQEYKTYNYEFDNNSNVVREFCVAYRAKSQQNNQPKQLTDSKISYDYIMNCGVYNKELCEIKTFEKFGIILLNRNNDAVGYCTIGVGGIGRTFVDVRKIAFYAVSTMSSAVILFHNHPSGRLKPSDEDKKITSSIIECLNMLDIKVLDHLVVTDTSYTSFLDEGFI